MTEPFSSALVRLLHENADSKTPEQFLREGRKSLRVITAAKIHEMIGLAVMRTLQHASQDPQESERLAHDAQQEFLRLMAENHDLHGVTRKLREEEQSLSRHVEELHQQLQSCREQLAGELERVQHVRQLPQQEREDTDAALDALLSGAVANAARGEDLAEVVAELRRELAALMARVAQSPDASIHGSAGRVELLERRIRKLSDSLSGAHQMLDRLNALQQEDERGVPSYYREPQGLHGDEPNVERRRTLMNEIFNYNRTLRETL